MKMLSRRLISSLVYSGRRSMSQITNIHHGRSMEKSLLTHRIAVSASNRYALQFCVQLVVDATRWHLKVSYAPGAQRLQEFIQNMCNDRRRIVLEYDNAEYRIDRRKFIKSSHGLDMNKPDIACG